MWANPQQQESIEKIRKAQWSEENTRRTQAVVHKLVAVKGALALLYGERNVAGLSEAIRDAVHRFAVLDKEVKVPDGL